MVRTPKGMASQPLRVDIQIGGGIGAPETTPKVQDNGMTNKLKKHLVYNNKLKTTDVLCHCQQTNSPQH
jgi:hypothetical protein